MLAENNGQKFDAWVRSHLDSKVTWMYTLGPKGGASPAGGRQHRDWDTRKFGAWLTFDRINAARRSPRASAPLDGLHAPRLRLKERCW